MISALGGNQALMCNYEATIIVSTCLPQTKWTGLSQEKFWRPKIKKTILNILIITKNLGL